MINKKQLRSLIERTLKDIGLYSKSAENLIYGTICVESKRGTYIKQLGGGPALGICQMEPATHYDVWDKFLKHKIELAHKIIQFGNGSLTKQLEYNMKYSIAMCRVHYLRVPKTLPQADDIKGLAAYWKKYYNTHLGAGRVEHFIRAYNN